MPQADDAPSAWQIEKSLAAWHAVREALTLNDSDLIKDETMIFAQFAPEHAHPIELLKRLIDATTWAERRAHEADQLRGEMAARRDRFIDRSTRMRQAIMDLMMILNQTNVAATFQQAVITRGRVGVRITDAAKVPDKFWRKPEPTPMLEAIHKAIDAGERVPGAELTNPANVVSLRPI